MKGSEVVLLVLVVVVVALAAVLYFWPFRPLPPPGLPAIRTKATTGTLGKYSLPSEQTLNDFNVPVTQWLTRQGFVPHPKETYAQIVGEKRWDMPGRLFANTSNPAGQMFVFLPDCYRPEERVQIIGLHTKARGPSDAVADLLEEFESIKEEFHEAFPSTWEYQPEEDDPPDAPDGEDDVDDP